MGEFSQWPETMGLLAQICEPSAKGHPRVRFQGREYIVVGDRETGGAIATPEQYENGECSYAHLFMPDGLILRFNEEIGTSADIEWLPDEPRAAPPESVSERGGGASLKGK